MSSLPPELDFTADPSATPARMDAAMLFILAYLRRLESVQPEFLSVTADLKATGLARLDAVLSPIFVDAQEIEAQLIAIRAAWITGQPLTQLLADLRDQVTARLGNVDSQLAANLAAVTQHLAASAPLASPEFTGVPKAPTAAAGANSTQIATTAFAAALVDLASRTSKAATLPSDFSQGERFFSSLLGDPASSPSPNAAYGNVTLVQDETLGHKLLRITNPNMYQQTRTRQVVPAIPGVRYRIEALVRVKQDGASPIGFVPNFYGMTAGYDDLRYGGYGKDYYAPGQFEARVSNGWFKILQEMTVVDNPNVPWLAPTVYVYAYDGQPTTAIVEYQYIRVTAAHIPEATTAEFLAQVPSKVLSPVSVWNAATPVGYGDAPSMTLNFSLMINASIVLTGNRTLANPINLRAGQSGFIIFTQDGTGGRTLSFGTAWKLGPQVPTLSTAPNARDILYYTVMNDGTVDAYLAKGR